MFITQISLKPIVLPFSDPSDLSGLKGWWDASDGTTLQKTGDLVDTWEDKGPDSKDFTGTTTTRPDHGIVGSQQNSLDVIDFHHATTEYLTGTYWAASVSQPWTLYIVAKFNATGDTAVDDRDNTCKFNRATSNYQINNGTVLNGATGDASWHVFGIMANGSSSKFRTDGNETTGNAGTNASTGLYLGRTQAGAGWLNGSIGELFFCSGDKSSQFDDIESYLGTKWNITIS